jgi:hypothetical protein
MRYLTLILLFSTSLCFSQPKDDTKIIVRATDTANLFKRVAESLNLRGYTLEAIDEQSKSIATAEKKLKRLNASMKVNISVKDAACIISGSYALDFHFKINSDKEDRIFNPVENRGMQGNIHRECWKEMQAIARSIGNEIEYSK